MNQTTLHRTALPRNCAATMNTFAMREGWRLQRAKTTFVLQAGCCNRNSRDVLSILPSCGPTMCATSSQASWIRTEQRPMHPDGYAMTRTNAALRLTLAVQAAAVANPDLAKRRVSPHTILHTTAIHLLQAGVDISAIALWLGHESSTTTHHYIEADLHHEGARSGQASGTGGQDSALPGA